MIANCKSWLVDTEFAIRDLKIHFKRFKFTLFNLQNLHASLLMIIFANTRKLVAACSPFAF